MVESIVTTQTNDSKAEQTSTILMEVTFWLVIAI